MNLQPFDCNLIPWNFQDLIGVESSTIEPPLQLLLKALYLKMGYVSMTIRHSKRLKNTFVGIKINYRLSTNSYTINILSYTVLDDDISYEKLPIEVRGS